MWSKSIFLTTLLKVLCSFKMLSSFLLPISKDLWKLFLARFLRRLPLLCSTHTVLGLPLWPRPLPGFCSPLRQNTWTWQRKKSKGHMSLHCVLAGGSVPAGWLGPGLLCQLPSLQLSWKSIQHSKDHCTQMGSRCHFRQSCSSHFYGSHPDPSTHCVLGW